MEYGEISPFLNGNPNTPNYNICRSANFKFKNFSSFPLWVVDGFGQIDPLPPLIPISGIPFWVDPSWAGWLCIEVTKQSVDMENQIENEKVTNQYFPFRVPVDYSERNKWSEYLPLINGVVFGNEMAAQKFVKDYGSYHRWLMKTSYGTAEQNSSLFGLKNHTGQTIYVVDDIDMEINVIPSTPDDSYSPYQFNHEIQFPPSGYEASYLRLFRHQIYSTAEGGEHGRVHYQSISVPWDIYNPVGKRSVFVSQLNAMCFDTMEAAEEFCETYETVDEYRRQEFGKTQEEFLDQISDEMIEENNAIRRKMVWLFTTISSLQLSSILGQFLIQNWLSKIGQPKEERKPDPGGGGEEPKKKKASSPSSNRDMARNIAMFFQSSFRSRRW